MLISVSRSWQTPPTLEPSSDTVSVVDEITADDRFDDLGTSFEQGPSSTESIRDDIFADDIWSDEEIFEDDTAAWRG